MVFLSIAPSGCHHLPPVGGRYGSGVPMGMSGCVFTLSSNAATIFSTGPMTHVSSAGLFSSSCGFV
jgi:hypothetical protein